MSCHGWLSLVCLPTCCLLVAGCRASAPEVAHRTPGMIDAARVAPASSSYEPTAGQENAHAVAAVSYTQDLDELPVPPLPETLFADSPEVITTPTPLELQNVILSVQQTYPLLVSALFERQIADGKQLSAWGAFDLGVKAFGIAAPEGYYKTYRNGIALDQPVFAGGYLYGGYKIGDGNFQPWYGERETNEGGEVAAGFGVPLLKDRSIDKRRESLFIAELNRQAAEPAIRAQLLEFVRVASQAYWSWIAAGQALEAERELLKLAQARVKQIEERVNAGDLGRIARINNEQLIASRETKVIESDRKLQQAAIKLSLFLRDGEGQPIIPDKSQLPAAFPEHVTPDARQLDADIARAVAARPELVELELIAEQVRVELAQAENMLLPKLDAQLLASKDLALRRPRRKPKARLNSK